ncbi:hypothetical protein E2320_000121 [Naja naja]|nr:hypothetical protein E2320_000121 [Naja naja]
MYPRVENVKNPHHFRFRVFFKELPQGISQNRWKTLKIHFILDLSFSEDLSQGISQNENITFEAELGFRKTLHFHILMVENIKIHIIFDSGFPLGVTQGISQNVGVEKLKIHFILGPAFPEQFSQGISKNDR